LIAKGFDSEAQHVHLVLCLL